MADQMSDDVDTVARSEIVAAIEFDLDAGHISHKSCPEIGVRDWELVEKRITEIMDGLQPNEEERTNSYARLIERAE